MTKDAQTGRKVFQNAIDGEDRRAEKQLTKIIMQERRRDVRLFRMVHW